MAEKTTSSAFEIDNRICIKIERELAVFIGTLILETDTKNTAALALGHQLKKLAEAKCKYTPISDSDNSCRYNPAS